MAKVSRSKLALALALLRELKAKIAYYSSMVERNVARYREFAKRVEKIDPSRAKRAEAEAKSLEALRNHLDRLSLFIDRILLKLETLLAVDDVASSVALLKGLVDEVKKSVAYKVPFIGVAIDSVDSLARELVSEVRMGNELGRGGVAIPSQEAKKVLEEAKKIAGLA